MNGWSAFFFSVALMNSLTCLARLHDEAVGQVMSSTMAGVSLFLALRFLPKRSP